MITLEYHQHSYSTVEPIVLFGKDQDPSLPLGYARVDRISMCVCATIKGKPYNNHASCLPGEEQQTKDNLTVQFLDGLKRDGIYP
jgi:hypothetical protein